MEAKLPTALDSQPGIHLRPSEADDGFPRATASLLAHMANNGFRPKTIQWDGEPHRFPGKDQRRDDSWLRLGRISDALSDDEERAKSAKRPNPKADPNPDYKHRPWAQWLKRAEAGTLASTAAAVGHVKRGGLVGVVPGCPWHRRPRCGHGQPHGLGTPVSSACQGGHTPGRPPHLRCSRQATREPA